MRAKQWQHGLSIGLLLVVAFWLVTSIWGLAGKALIAVSQARDAKVEYQLLESRKIELTANLAALNTERGKDAAIRTAFGVARPGEEVIVVVSPVAPVPIPVLSWWQKFLHWF